MMKRVVIAAFLAIAMFSTLAVAQNAREIYQRALVQEQGAGNLRQAIELYQQAAKEAGPDRELAAKALIRAAGCYEKLGEPKAAALYTQVVSSYPEQREFAAEAQAALTKVVRGKPTGKVVPVSLSAEISSTVVPVLNNYCIGCHNQTRKVSGLALDSLRDHLVSSNPNAAADAEVWEKVLTRLRSRTMPPAGQPRPDASVNQSTITLIETALDRDYPQPLLSSERVTDSELATRLSKFLWNADPDATLADLARRGRLSDPATLEQEVRRMLKDAKAESFTLRFFDPWLRLGDVVKAPLSAGSPAELDDALRQSMRRETQLFITNLLREDRPAMELWSSNTTFVDDRLAQYYGIPNVTGNSFRRVTRTGNERSGLLGQGAILTLTSNYAPRSGKSRTSPVMRGKWFYSTFFGLSVPPPPPSVSPLEQDGSPDANTRKRMEAHRVNPNCANCHQTFEQFGIALENFDAMGRYREQDGGEPVNASGAFADGSTWLTPVQFTEQLSRYQDAFVTNATEVLLSYALGRARHNSDGSISPGRYIHAGEEPAVRAIVREAAVSNYTWSSIIAGIVKSQPFQMKVLLP